MNRWTILTLTVALAAPLLAADHSTANEKFLQEYKKHWQTAGDFTIAVAEKMPAGEYNSMPNPEEMDFGKLMIHIASANAYFFSGVTGHKVDVGKPSGTDKTAIIAFLRHSFDTVAQELATLPDERLDATSPLEGQQMTGREGMMAALAHISHHRGQAEVYLRYKNIKPPDYTF